MIACYLQELGKQNVSTLRASIYILYRHQEEKFFASSSPSSDDTNVHFDVEWPFISSSRMHFKVTAMMHGLDQNVVD